MTQEQLKALWHRSRTTVHHVLTQEMEYIEGATVRITPNGWLYADERNGFSLMSSGEVSTWTLRPVPGSARRKSTLDDTQGFVEALDEARYLYQEILTPEQWGAALRLDPKRVAKVRRHLMECGVI